MFGLSFLVQLPSSRSCALKIDAWNGASLISEVPKSPQKNVVLADAVELAQVLSTEVTNPFPRTAKLVGSVTLVELWVWSTSTPGASSSATWMSIGFGCV